MTCTCLQQLDVEAVQSARGPDVEGIFCDLLDRRDARQGKEKPEMIWKVLVGAGDGFTAVDILRLKGLAIRRQDELGLGPCSRRAGPKVSQLARYLSSRRNGDMDVVGLKDTADI